MKILNVYTQEVIFEDEKATTWEEILRGAIQAEANLRGANLRGANLYGADLRGADLRGADLRGADLYGADLRGADLRGADLYGADLRGADLRGANLREANLREANLRGANLREANLYGAKEIDAKFLAQFKITPEEGEFKAWKKTSTGVIQILIPEHASRCNAVGSRKCRASEVVVIGGEGVGGKSPTHTEKALTYNIGDTVKADKYDDNIFEECSGGIHFFMTKQEAQDYI